MGRGDALGLNYQIPQNFIGGMQGNAPAQPAGIDPQDLAPPEKAGDYLSHVEGITNKYYDTYAQLKSFAHDMAKRGVDVFTPDYTQPGGGEPFRTATKLQAALQYKANDLKNSRDIDQTVMKLKAAGIITQNPDFDPTQQMSAATNPNDMFTSTSLNPQVQNASKDLSGTFYTNRDAQAKNQAVRNPLIDYYQKRIQQDPANAGYYQAQIAGIPEATAQTSYQQLVPRRSSGSSKVPPGISVLKKVVNLSSGVWNDGTYKPVTKNAKVYLENSEMAGESLGQYMHTDNKGKISYKPKTIKRWLKDPDTGEVSIEYQDPEIPNDVVSSQPGATATNFIANNSKYGDAGKTLDIANSMGLVDDTGSVIPELLQPENANEIKNKVRSAGHEANGRIKERVDRNIEQLDKMEDPGWWLSHNSVGYKLPTGKEITIKKHRGKKSFYIDKPEDFFGKTEGTDNLSSKDVMTILGSLGLFESDLSEAKPSKARPY